MSTTEMFRYVNKLPRLSLLRRGLTTRTNYDYDVVIVGGGLMGCSSAYHLISHDPSLRVCIVEKDPMVSGSCL